MNALERRLVELAQRRGQLSERIYHQRRSLIPKLAWLRTVASGCDMTISGVRWLKKHPLEVGAAALLFTALRPKRAWRWAVRGFSVWRFWRKGKKFLARWRF